MTPNFYIWLEEIRDILGQANQPTNQRFWKRVIALYVKRFDVMRNALISVPFLDETCDSPERFQFLLAAFLTLTGSVPNAF